MVGEIELVLDASITAFDTAWICALEDVAPDGSAIAVTHGWLRAALREVDAAASRPGRPVLPLTTPQAVIPHEIVQYRIPVLPNARRFATGHRIRLSLTSDDRTRVQPVLQSFTHTPVGNSSVNTVHSSSRLLLPALDPTTPPVLVTTRDRQKPPATVDSEEGAMTESHADKKTGAPRVRGPRGRRGDVAGRIVAAARQRFAADGFDATPITTIARDADVDAKLVHYYFPDKQRLLEAALVVPPQFAAAARAANMSPLPGRGEAIVANLLASWADPDVALVLRSMLLMAAHEQLAMLRVRSFFEDALLAAVEEGLPEGEREFRAALVSSQLIGLAFSRYVFELRQATAADDQTLVRVVGATIQRYLTGPLTTLA